MDSVKVSARGDSHALVKVVQGECAPNVTTLAPGVCSDRESLDQLRTALKIMATQPQAIVAEAEKKTGCSSESCALKKAGVKVDERFRPEGPWKSTTWLSNQDIDDVLDQYAKKFPEFKHVEFQMRDFESQGGELARVPWCDVAKQYTSLGCVINTDLSSGSGEHWTPIFVDFPGGTVEYFDSAGQEPHKEFSSFIIKVAHTLSQCTGRKFRDVCLTNVEHQKENTECGVYSLYYILSRLHRVGYKAFEFKRVPDDMMVLFRQSIFRHS